MNKKNSNHNTLAILTLHSLKSILFTKGNVCNEKQI